MKDTKTVGWARVEKVVANFNNNISFASSFFGVIFLIVGMAKGESFLEAVTYSGPFVLIGLAGMLFRFLRGKPLTLKYSYSDEDRKQEIRELIFKLDGAENAIKLLNEHHGLTDEDSIGLRKKVVSAFDSLKNNVYTKNLLDEDISESVGSPNTRIVVQATIVQLRNFLNERLGLLSRKVSAEDDERSSRDRATLLSERIQKRLLKEIEQLSLRATVYIVIGTLITICAGVYLYILTGETIKILESSDFSNKDFYSGNVKTFMSVGVRLSLVIFVEIFAYYFLRLYREVMQNIKYYQNEITNIELKTLSLLAAYSSQDDKSLDVIISELVKSERNFILKSGETTVEIEKQKNEQSTFNEALGKIVAILRKEK